MHKTICLLRHAKTHPASHNASDFFAYLNQVKKKGQAGEAKTFIKQKNET